MLVRALIDGRLDEVLAAGLKRVAPAVQAGVRDYADDVRDELRDDFVRAGIGAGGGRDLSGAAWRVNHYPRGASDTLDPASLVYTQVPTIIRAFEDGAVVRSRQGRLLLVPNDEVWPRGRVTRSRSGASTFAAGVRRFGPLQFVPNRGKPGGRFVATGAGKRGGPQKPIVVFWAVPEIRQPKLLRGAEIRDRVEREAPGQVDARFQRALARTAGPPTS